MLPLLRLTADRGAECNSWVAWAMLSEEELSWAIAKIYNTVNVYE